MVSRRITAAERRARLGERHHLAAPADTAVDVARALIGLHGTDPASVYLAAAARIRSPDIAAIEREAYERRRLVRMLCMRRTVFTLPAELAPVVQRRARTTSRAANAAVRSSSSSADNSAANEPWVALLPALDPTVMGWTGRDWYLGGHGPALFDRSGNAGPTVWANGRIVGGWAQREDGEVVHRLLGDVGTEATAAVATEAARLTEWLTPVRITPRFRTPLERELTA